MFFKKGSSYKINLNLYEINNWIQTCFVFYIVFKNIFAYYVSEKFIEDQALWTQIMKNSITNKENCLEGFETPRGFSPKKSKLDGDRLNVLVLIVLYVIQGFVIGFSTALPIILQSRKTVTYEDQVSLKCYI